MRLNLGLYASCAVAAIAAPPAAVAAALDANVAFNIPAQSLAPALLVFSRQSGVQVISAAEPLKNKFAPMLQGNTTPRLALATLLKYTALKFVAAGESTVTIVAAPEGPVRGAGSQFAQNDAARRAPPENGLQSSPISPTAPEADEENQVLVVTGSRIERPGYAAPTPVTAATGEQLNLSNPSGPGDALKALPILASSVAPRGSTGSSGTGGTYLNLRNLGANNTLVLLNGERFVPATGNGTVDIAMIPTALIQRVDIVTGGASAAYGSDAVTGVVNFILDNKYTGLKGSLAGGISSRKQNSEVKGTFAAGAGFGGGRGHGIIGIEYYKSEGLYSLIQTVNGQRSCQTIALPAGSATSQGYACDVRSSQANFTGIISGPSRLAGTTFDAVGNPIPFNYGTFVTSTTMVGGDGIKPQFLPAAQPLERGVFHGRLSWEFSEKLQIYSTLTYGISNHHYQIGSYDLNLGTTALTIRSDNAYLAPSLRAVMVQNNIPSFTFNKYFANLPRTEIENDYTTGRAVFGAQGRLGSGWSWDAHGEVGKTRNNNYNYYNELLPNMALAADAVVDPATGRIVCRSTLTNPTNGCVPYNVMGSGGIIPPTDGRTINTATDAQLAYLTGSNWRRTRIREKNVAVNVNGKPFSTWAGPVSVAFGGEWRYNSMRQTADPRGAEFNPITNATGPYRSGNFLPQAGQFNVYEGYIETVVPLARNVAFLDEVDFNGAARLAHYSTSGKAFTWKAGLTAGLTNGLRFRGTVSRDVRAPNLIELFAAQSLGATRIVDNVTRGNPVNAQALLLIAGNPALQAQTAKTKTAGVVYQPTWLPRFQASIDAYSIKIRDAIATPNSQLLVQDCANGAVAQCAFIVRDASGQLTGIRSVPQNLQSITTEGADIEANYRLSLAEISRLPGQISLHGIANYVRKYSQITQGVQGVNLAGQNNYPRWRWTMQAAYSLKPIEVFVQARYSGSGLFDKSIPATTLPPMHVPGQVLLDTNVNYDFKLGSHRAQLFVNVTNVFDRIPPPFADGAGQNAGGTGRFDPLGRYYRAGVRFEY